MILLNMIQPDVNPQDLFTLGSFTTLAGSALIVYIICGAIQHAFNFSPKWLALVIAMIISCIAAYIGNTLNTPENPPEMEIWLVYLLAILNGFLIYMTAIGTNQLAAPNPQPPTAPTPPAHPGPKSAPVQKRTFRSSWLNP